jgi:Gpi18-like mannosyltransferase
VVLLCLFPTAFFFSAVYTESLFLLVTVACLYFARQGQWLQAGLAGALAVLTRNTGLLLLVPLATLYFGGADRRRWRDWRLACFALLPAGLAVWAAFLWRRFGDPLAFLKAQAHWGRKLAMPWVAIERGLRSGLVGIGALRNGLGATVIDSRGRLVIPVALPNALALCVLLGAVAILCLTARRQKPAYLCYAIAALLVPLFSPSDRQPLLSLPRFVLVCFPVFVGLALLTERLRWTRLVLAVALALGLVALTTVFVRFYFVA